MTNIIHKSDFGGNDKPLNTSLTFNSTAGRLLDLNEIESDGPEPQEFGQSWGTVDVDSTSELEYWSREFQVSEDELRSAIIFRGNSIAEIKKYLSE